MLKYLLAYEVGHAFPRLVLGALLALICAALFALSSSAISYRTHPYHYELRGDKYVEVPGKMEWPADRARALRGRR